MSNAANLGLLALRVAVGGMDGWPLPELPLTGARVPW